MLSTHLTYKYATSSDIRIFEGETEVGRIYDSCCYTYIKIGKCNASVCITYIAQKGGFVNAENGDMDLKKRIINGEEKGKYQDQLVETFAKIYMDEDVVKYLTTKQISINKPIMDKGLLLETIIQQAKR